MQIGLPVHIRRAQPLPCLDDLLCLGGVERGRGRGGPRGRHIHCDRGDREDRPRPSAAEAPNGVENIKKIVAGKQLWNYDNLEPAEKKLVL